MNYALVGYGRMGRAIEAEATARGHRRVARVDPDLDPTPIEAVGRSGAQVAFEFTAGAVAERNLVELLGGGVPVVCGTTGWVPSPAVAAAASAGGVGVVIAPNFSVGVQLFFRLAREAARLLGALGPYDPFVHEAHHRAKLDAPSGTARRLAEILLAAGPQPAGRLDVSSTRAGFEPGRHTVGFDGPHDLITLEHRARGREAFASGAVLAAEWLLAAPPGVHPFDDVLEGILRGAGSSAGGAG